jgi:hypothetical protein
LRRFLSVPWLSPLNGRDDAARFEEHENAEGAPDRPPGKHKGVTVYETPHAGGRD